MPLRHFYGTQMMADGASMDLVKRMMGHSRIGMTSDTYGHVTTMHEHDARERMERIMRTVQSG